MKDDEQREDHQGDEKKKRDAKYNEKNLKERLA
jgi:hypothetical protein